MNEHRSTHRVTRGWRWFIVATAPLLIALMVFAIHEVVTNYLDGDKNVSIGIAIFAVCLFGAMIVMFVGAVLFAFYGRVILDDNSMTLVGAFKHTVVPVEQLEGFTYVQGRLHVKIRGRRFMQQIAYVDDMPVIEQWLRNHTINTAAEALAEEDAEISADLSLGMTDAAREERLAALRRRVRRASWLIYAAIGTYFVNAWFIERPEIMYTSLAVLVLAPLYLDFLGLANRGHVRVDHEQGSRYPEILSVSIFAGAILSLVAIADHGAFIGTDFWELFAVVTVLKFMLWYFIDAQQLRARRERGLFGYLFSVFSMIMLGSFWAGGSLYMVNRHLDMSEPIWHETSVVSVRKSSGRRTSYSVNLAPWRSDQAGPVNVSISKRAYESLQQGMAVDVAVNKGAIGAAWVSGIRRRN